MLKIFILVLLFIFNPIHIFSKETNSELCYKRGVEIILPYEQGIKNIKKKSHKSIDLLKTELRNFKDIFETTFFGINLYESSGCSKARMSEYLDCLVETDGKDCKIYYSQMRLVD